MMPPWSEFVVVALLLASGVLVLTAGVGLVRLADFFLRMHAPALATSLGAWLVTFATIVHFSVQESSLALHTWLVIIVLSITAPVSAMLLSRAALFRRRQAGDETVPARLRGDLG
jgi:multicomponent K+:H+ antiporter subunit G